MHEAISSFVNSTKVLCLVYGTTGSFENSIKVPYVFYKTIGSLVRWKMVPYLLRETISSSECRIMVPYLFTELSVALYNTYRTFKYCKKNMKPRKARCRLCKTSKGFRSEASELSRFFWTFSSSVGKGRNHFGHADLKFVQWKSAKLWKFRKTPFFLECVSSKSKLPLVTLAQTHIYR